MPRGRPARALRAPAPVVNSRVVSQRRDIAVERDKWVQKKAEAQAVVARTGPLLDSVRVVIAQQEQVRCCPCAAAPSASLSGCRVLPLPSQSGGGVARAASSHWHRTRVWLCRSELCVWEWLAMSLCALRVGGP